MNEEEDEESREGEDFSSLSKILTITSIEKKK